uniref:NME/NM23 family member 5 n=1 Tax=Nothobranchius furzeri TaxID=105023 RepID=A0A8C6LWP2_NOTFU
VLLQTPPYHRVIVEKTLAVIKPDAFQLADEIENVIVKSGFSILQEKPLNPCIWLADWLLKNNPNQPQICDKDTVED